MSRKGSNNFGSAGESTRVLHEGVERFTPNFPLTQPIYPTATFIFKDTADLCAYHGARIRGEDTGRHEYGRYTNPTIDACEAKLAALDHGEEAVLFPSGMAAISTTLIALLSPGAHVIIGSDCYRRTRQLCLTTLARCGITTSVVPMGDYDALEKAIQPKTEIIMFETPTNPYLRIVDLKRLVSIARRKGVLTFIDATFASPINQTPLDFGIDLVTHAATKYLSGHNNLLSGAVIGRRDLIAKIRNERGILGGMPDALSVSKLIDQIKTLALRVRAQNETAAKVAEFLAVHPAIEKVWYPGHKSHPEYEIAREQMSGFGGVVSFEVKGTLEDTARFIDAMKLPRIAPSLGGVDSLIEQPALMSFFELTTKERLALGMKDNLVRFAIGIEDASDVISDLDQALAQLGAVERKRHAASAVVQSSSISLAE
jgi:cystathionine gamma-synthase